MLSRHRCAFLRAEDPVAGKTIMAGLLDTAVAAAIWNALDRRPRQRRTMHDELRETFIAEYGCRRGIMHLTITGTLYEIDRNRLTCSGGAATWTGDRRAWYP
ncbi:type 1 glutamine amidotransferase family protein [Paracoccus mutanolyticus]|uniref:hypothetical protein n=1 Tax=Paracoccus mutanolyticus TaxID=1499308 RepID=UPI0016737FCE|nr:hypothetical protein [Paracoccus mutanolyticus]